MKNVSILFLCGGLGKRLGNRTEMVPKALIPVNGQPIISYSIDHFLKTGFNHMIFGTGYLSQEIESYLSKEKPQLAHKISNAGEAASMLARIYQAQEFYSDEVIVCYGDTFVDIDYKELVNRFRSKNALAMMVTGQIQNPFGLVTINADEQVSSFVEKPIHNYYIGCFIFKRDMLKEIDPQWIKFNDAVGIVKLFEKLSAKKELYAFHHEGFQVTFNTEQELENADRILKEYYTVAES